MTATQDRLANSVSTNLKSFETVATSLPFFKTDATLPFSAIFFNFRDIKIILTLRIFTSCPNMLPGAVLTKCVRNTSERRNSLGSTERRFSQSVPKTEDNVRRMKGYFTFTK